MSLRRGRRGALPNLVVIGAQKCGTSALHYYLDLHPQVSMSHPKELNFFVDPSEPAPDATGVDPRDLRNLRRAPRNWHLGVDWYAAHFDSAQPVRGEASPLYTSPGFPDVAARMADVIPAACLIYMIRDPVERMIAHYMHLRANGIEHRDPETAFTASGNIYLARSRYHANLLPFLERFGRDRILVLRQEELLRSRRETVRAAFAFAGVDDSFWSPKMARERNVSAQKGPGTRLLWALQRLPVTRLGHHLPQEVKWRLERGFTRRDSRETPRPAIGELRAALVAELREEIEAMAELGGLDLDAYLRPSLSRK